MKYIASFLFFFLFTFIILNQSQESDSAAIVCFVRLYVQRILLSFYLANRF